MKIRKEDKRFLNETLKRIINRKVLGQDFRDHDRPMERQDDVMRRVKEDAQWVEKKTQLGLATLKEMAMEEEAEQTH